MGVDSALVNTRTKEYFDVRGFWRFTLDEVRTALASREATYQLVLQYANRPGATPEYREWLTDRLISFAARGGATPTDIELCHDNVYDGGLSWYDVIEEYHRVGDVGDYYALSGVP